MSMTDTARCEAAERALAEARDMTLPTYSRETHGEFWTFHLARDQKIMEAFSTLLTFGDHTPGIRMALVEAVMVKRDEVRVAAREQGRQ